MEKCSIVPELFATIYFYYFEFHLYLAQNMIDEKRRVFGLLYNLYNFLYIWVEQNLQFSIVLYHTSYSALL